MSLGLLHSAGQVPLGPGGLRAPGSGLPEGLKKIDGIYLKAYLLHRYTLNLYLENMDIVNTPLKSSFRVTAKLGTEISHITLFLKSKY